MKVLSLATAVAALLTFSTQAGATTITYVDFSSTSGLTINGNAAQVGNVLRVTPAIDGQAGSFFSTQRRHARSERVIQHVFPVSIYEPRSGLLRRHRLWRRRACVRPADGWQQRRRRRRRHRVCTASPTASVSNSTTGTTTPSTTSAAITLASMSAATSTHWSRGDFRIGPERRCRMECVDRLRRWEPAPRGSLDSLRDSAGPGHPVLDPRSRGRSGTEQRLCRVHVRHRRFACQPRRAVVAVRRSVCAYSWYSGAEPASILLLGSGLIAGVRRYKKRRAA